MSDIQLYKWSLRDAPAVAWQRLTQFALDVTTRLNRGLTFAGNVDAQILDVTFDGPVSVLSVQTRYQAPPMGCVLVRLLNVATGASSNVAFGWHFEGAGLVTTTAFSGLAAGRYEARLLVLGA
jgi:hypothetical protein